MGVHKVIFMLIACATLSSAFRIRPNTASHIGKRVLCMASPALQLYGNQGSRSPLVNWYLEEIKTPYTLIDIWADPSARESNPHTSGQIPALRDEGGVEVFESGAILLYLADKYGGLDTPAKRSAAYKWVVWANATLDPAVFKEVNGKVVGTGLQGATPRVIAVLEQVLSRSNWLVDDTFSVSDVGVGSYLLYAAQFFPNVDLTRYPAIASYMKRCAQRPAYAVAFGADTAQRLVAHCGQYSRH